MSAPTSSLSARAVVGLLALSVLAVMLVGLAVTSWLLLFVGTPVWVFGAIALGVLAVLVVAARRVHRSARTAAARR